MPGFLLHLGATVMCAHAGQATPVAPTKKTRATSRIGASATFGLHEVKASWTQANLSGRVGATAVAAA